MMIRVSGLEQRLAQFCGADVALWRAPLTRDADTDSAMGARMVRQVKRWLGHSDPVKTRIRRPQRDHSLTHAGDQLLALAVRSPTLSGLGLDFEPWRELDARHQRLMLTARERDLLRDGNSADLLRIWTVKEACFKADRGGQQHWVTHYELQHPTRRSGIARVRNGNQLKSFRYISFALPTGIVSAAFASGDGYHEGH